MSRSSRDVIRARRARFVAAALTAVSLGGACSGESEPQACLSPLGGFGGGGVGGGGTGGTFGGGAGGDAATDAATDAEASTDAKDESEAATDAGSDGAG